MKNQINWPEAVSRIFVAAIFKGSLPTLCFGIYLIIVAWRLPPDQLAKATIEIIKGIKDFSLFGYFLFGSAIVGWVAHVSWLVKRHDVELTRISSARNEAQKRLNPDIESTKQKKGGEDQ